MATKRQQALYELMGGGSRPEPPNKPPARTPPPSLPRWFSAGRAVRVPVGYLLLGTGIAVMVVSAVFSLGYVRGRGDARREFDAPTVAPGCSASCSRRGTLWAVIASRV